MMFGGDDVNALIFDIGTNNTKVGYSSKDLPSCIYPTVVGLNTMNILNEKKIVFFYILDLLHCSLILEKIRYLLLVI